MSDDKTLTSYDLINDAYRRGQESMKARAIQAAKQDAWDRRMVAGPLVDYIKMLEIHDAPLIEVPSDD